MRPLNEAFPVFAACVSGDQAQRPITCLTGVSALDSACTNGVHPEFGCKTGTLPGTDCISGVGHGEW